MKNIMSIVILVLVISGEVASQIPGAQQQPQWAMPFFFEDANGEKDTIWAGYDSIAEKFHGIFDSTFEQWRYVDTTKFQAFLYLTSSTNPTDSAKKIEIIGSTHLYDLTIDINFINGKMPITMKWDNSKLYSDSLPYPDISPRPRARVDMDCNNGEPGYFYCHISSEHPPIILSDYYVQEFQYTQVYSDSFHFDGSGNMPAEDAISLNLRIVPHNASYLGIEKNKETFFNIYPNPATEEVFITNKIQGEYSVTIYTMDGRIKDQWKNLLNTKENLSISYYKPGLYLIQVKTGSISEFKKLIIY